MFTKHKYPDSDIILDLNSDNYSIKTDNYSSKMYVMVMINSLSTISQKSWMLSRESSVTNSLWEFPNQ